MNSPHGASAIPDYHLEHPAYHPNAVTNLKALCIENGKVDVEADEKVAWVNHN